MNNTAPRRVLSDELTRAEKWQPWPDYHRQMGRRLVDVLDELEAERPVPIEEPPPQEATEVEQENEPDEDDEEESRSYSYQEFLEASEGIKNP